MADKSVDIANEEQLVIFKIQEELTMSSTKQGITTQRKGLNQKAL